MLIAIDPGDAHTGVAEFGANGPVAVYTLGRQEAEDHIATIVGGGDELVIEEFRLYPWMQDVQGFSDFPTSQLIGALRYIARSRGAQVHMQPATVKKPTFGQLRARAIELHGQNQHELDAEAHGWHHLLAGAQLRS